MWVKSDNHSRNRQGHWECFQKNWHTSGLTSFPITLICHDRSSLTRHESRLMGHDSSRFICRSIEPSSSIAVVPLTGARFARRAFRSRELFRRVTSNRISRPSQWQRGPALNRTDRLARNPRGKVNLNRRSAVLRHEAWLIKRTDGAPRKSN